MPDRRLRWRDLYREAELYKAALRVYTKPLFHWRKALSASSDARTLYDLASQGLRGLEAIHRALQQEAFTFRPALARHFNFNGKERTLYLSPWEERIVDLLLYRLLNRRLHAWFSPHSYAYRDRVYGLDRCQRRAAGLLRAAAGPLYVVKRDIANYFASVQHAPLLAQLAGLADPADYLYRLLEQRVCFLYQEGPALHTATRGIPFGSAAACLLANVHLTGVDRAMEQVPGVAYFRYADDLLLISANRDAALAAAARLEAGLKDLGLACKPSHSAEWLVARRPTDDAPFVAATHFRHLGLDFRAGGGVGLSRDKTRKIQNLFRFAFRRSRRRWSKVQEPAARARMLCALAAYTLQEGVRNVAIVDYYLKHVDDEAQLRALDRWLAEEVLSLVFGGHKKSHFRRLGFVELRALGLPSLVHRRRLLQHRHLESPFFVWRQRRAARACKGAAATPRAFSPAPEAAATKSP